MAKKKLAAEGLGGYEFEYKEGGMKLSELIEGLQILKPHYKGADGFHVGAEHDVLYAYPTETPLLPEELDRMVTLGWFQEDVNVPEEDGEFMAQHYDVEQGWAAFV